MSENVNPELVTQLATGFGALLEQVLELEKNNAHLESLLDRLQKQAQTQPSGHTLAHHPHSTPSIFQRDFYNTKQESGLDVDFEGDHLRLQKVPENIRSHITDGFKAWSSLRAKGVGWHPRLDTYTTRTQRGSFANSELSSPNKRKLDGPQCPFASQPMSNRGLSHPKESSPSNGSPTLQDHAPQKATVEDSTSTEARLAEAASYHPSQTGSAAKCPIRFLDQYSPEEVAAYFKDHKHELPRSHEVCVKRYQRNEDQIRQLDHKYGNLVNMIQGLGQKHQPMLHTKTEEENASHGHAPQTKVEAWANEVNDDHDVGDDTPRLRDGRFDRPLKEIRVGESPSRPWGISVPHAAHIPPSAASGQDDPTQSNAPPPDPPTPSSRPPEGPQKGSPIKLPSSTEGQAKMVFTGPVFIGYSPEQTTDMLRNMYLGKAQAE
ncbi:MAG: hypothetical protein Q9219_005430 [cf. Caloplaca sp. 3 TL-2023]